MEPLYGVRCTAEGCGLTLLLCRRCYRGHRYCSQSCRQRTRREQCRAAQRTYVADKKGRIRAAAASRAYRKTRGAGRRATRSTRDSPRAPANVVPAPTSDKLELPPAAAPPSPVDRVLIEAATSAAAPQTRESSPAAPEIVAESSRAAVFFVIDQGLPAARDQRYASIPTLRCARCGSEGRLRRPEPWLRRTRRRASHDP